VRIWQNRATERFAHYQFKRHPVQIRHEQWEFAAELGRCQIIPVGPEVVIHYAVTLWLDEQARRIRAGQLPGISAEHGQHLAETGRKLKSRPKPRKRPLVEAHIEEARSGKCSE
jgi:hypothetical protein